jgi:hypothetical protein
MNVHPLKAERMKRNLTQQLLADFTPASEVLENMLYSPALLLDGRFDASFVDHADFGVACRVGFEAWIEETFGYDEHGQLVLDRASYTQREVGDVLVANVCRRYDGGEAFFGVPSLPWRAGFLLGWLSALALLDAALAVRCVGILSDVVLLQKYEEEQRGYNPYVCLEGLCERNHTQMALQAGV